MVGDVVQVENMKEKSRPKTCFEIISDLEKTQL